MSWLIDPAQQVLGAALNGIAKQQQVVASNLANIDTPGYRPRSLDFETALRAELEASGAAGILDGDGVAGPDGRGMRAPSTSSSAASGLARSDPRHLSGLAGPATGAGAGIETFDANLRNDTNTVDLESEVTALAENQIKFAAVSRLLTGKLGMLRDVATGGR